MKLFLIRHAMPALENYDNRFPGPGLGELGLQQSQWIAQRLSREKIETIWASDFVRTLETASFLRRVFPDAKFSKDSRLRERQAAEESHESLVARVAEWFEEVVGKVWKRPLAIIAHGGSINMILAHIDPGFKNIRYPFIDQYDVRTPIAGIWTLDLENDRAELTQCPLQ